MEEKRWSMSPPPVASDFRGLRPRNLLAVVVCALAVAPAAVGATTPTAPVYDGKGHLVQTPFVPTGTHEQLTKQRALRSFERDSKVSDWLARYPKKGLVDEETFYDKTSSWTVKIWWG